MKLVINNDIMDARIGVFNLRNLKRLDWTFAGLVLILAAMGILTLISANRSFSFGVPYYFKQIVFLVMGCSIALFIKKVANPFHITYLHGRYDDKEIILKTYDYFKFYRIRNGGEASNLEKMLMGIFCSRDAIVFVGFSFEDRFVLEVFEHDFQKLKEEVENAKIWKGIHPNEIRHYALLGDPLAEGIERETWLIDNADNICNGSKDYQDALEVEKRRKLEGRLREINIEVIRYGHDNHIDIESFFENLHTRKRGIQDFPRK